MRITSPMHLYHPLYSPHHSVFILGLPSPMPCMVEWRVGWLVNGRQTPGHQGAPPRSPFCPALTFAELITGTRMLEGKNKTISSFGWEPGHCLQDPTVFLKYDGASLRLRWYGPGLSEHCSQSHGSSLLPGEGGPEKNPEKNPIFLTSSRDEGRLPCFTWKGMPTSLSHLERRLVST